MSERGKKVEKGGGGGAREKTGVGRKERKEFN